VPAEGEWLNSNIIDAYLSLVSRMDTNNTVRYVPTYAVLSIQRKGTILTEWSLVSEKKGMVIVILKRMDQTSICQFLIFRYWRHECVDKVLVPAHLNDNHWAMVVATVPARTIELFDSMNNNLRTETKKGGRRSLVVKLPHIQCGGRRFDSLPPASNPGRCGSVQFVHAMCFTASVLPVSPPSLAPKAW
jgi:hypothetical protein